MKRLACRSCRAPLIPIFQLENVPAAAQRLPCEADLASEQGRDLKVFQCLGCGLVQLACEPVPYHREVITAAALSPAMRAFRQGQLQAFVDRFSLQGRVILEVGSGEGHLLDLLENAGAQALGLEAGVESVEIGCAQGRHLVEGYLTPEFSLGSRPVDAFVILNFLEHAPDPVVMLRTLAAQLSAGAPGLVEVPSFEHMIESERFYDFIPDHLSYFTHETLTHLMESAGFEVLDCQRVWHDYDLAAIVRKRPALDTVFWTRRQSALLTELRTFLRAQTSHGRRLAVWGASHQALTILALGQAREVAYVIDSAPFKQGRFTPVIHTPIVAPETLGLHPVDTILVMAAGYSDEVVRLLRTRHGFLGRIAVLRNAALEEVPDPEGGP